MNDIMKKWVATSFGVIMFLVAFTSAFPVVIADSWWTDASDLTPDIDYADDFQPFDVRDTWNPHFTDQVENSNIQSPGANFIPIGCTHFGWEDSTAVLYYNEISDQYAISWDLSKGEVVSGGEDFHKYLLFTQVYYIPPGATSESQYILIVGYDSNQFGDVSKHGYEILEPEEDTAQYMISHMLHYRDNNKIGGEYTDIDPDGIYTADADGKIKWDIAAQYVSLHEETVEADWWVKACHWGLVIGAVTLAVASIALTLADGGVTLPVTLALASIACGLASELFDDDDTKIYKTVRTGLLSGDYTLSFIPEVAVEISGPVDGEDTRDYYESNYCTNGRYDDGRYTCTVLSKKFRNIFVEVEIPQSSTSTIQSEIEYLEAGAVEWTNFPSGWENNPNRVTITAHKITINIPRDGCTHDILDKRLQGDYSGSAEWEFRLNVLVDYETKNPASGQPGNGEIPPEDVFDPNTDEYFYKFVETVDMLEDFFYEETGITTAEDLSAKLIEIYDANEDLVCVYPWGFYADEIFHGLSEDDPISYNGDVISGEYYIGSGSSSTSKQLFYIYGKVDGALDTNAEDNNPMLVRVKFDNTPRESREELVWGLNVNLENVLENIGHYSDWVNVGDPVIDDVRFNIALNPDTVDVDKSEVCINFDTLAVTIRLEDFDDYNAIWSVGSSGTGYVWTENYDLIAIVNVQCSMSHYIFGLEDENEDIYGMEVKANKPLDDYPQMGTLTFEEIYEPPPGAMYAYINTDDELVVNIDKTNDKVTVEKYKDSMRDFDTLRCIEFPTNFLGSGTYNEDFPVNINVVGDLLISVDTMRDHTLNLVDNKDQITVIFDVEWTRMSSITTSGQIYIVNADFLTALTGFETDFFAEFIDFTEVLEEGIQVTTDKNTYDIGEDVIITITNTGESTVNEEIINIKTENDGEVIWAIMLDTELEPDESLDFIWEQINCVIDEPLIVEVKFETSSDDAEFIIEST